jgi:hypothetical protein
MLDEVLFIPNFKAVLIAHDYKAMTDIFEKVKLAWNEFPREIKTLVGWEETTDNKNAIKFNNYSSFTVALSSRSGTVNHLHVSEFGKICKEYPEKAKEIISGAFPSVVSNGRIDIESTVEEAGGKFKEFWDEAVDTITPQTSKKTFKRFFFSWMDEKKYIEDPTYLYSELEQKYLDYQKLHNLSNAQICWYASTDKEQKGDMKRQYPTTIEEAFSSSIDAYFDTIAIQTRIQNDVQEPLLDLNGWVIFDTYNPKHRYGMGADPAEGIGRDHSTAVIIDFSHRLSNYQIVPRVVARYKNNKIDPIDFGQILADGGNMFGGCIIAPERNNHGHAVIGKLKEMYGMIYKQRVKDYVEEKEVDRYGFSTTAATKPELLSQLRAVINEFLLIIPDIAILKECEVYGVEDYKRVKGDENITNHFDLVMALAIAWEMRNYAIEGYHSEPEYTTMPMDSDSMMFQV